MRGTRSATCGWPPAPGARRRSRSSASTRKPRQPDARLRLGRAYEQLGRLDDAASSTASSSAQAADLQATVRLSEPRGEARALGCGRGALRAALHRARDEDGLDRRSGSRRSSRSGRRAHHARRTGMPRGTPTAKRPASTRRRASTASDLGGALAGGGERHRTAAWRIRSSTAAAPAPPELWQAMGDAALRDAGRLARRVSLRAIGAVRRRDGTAALTRSPRWRCRERRRPGATASLETMFSAARSIRRSSSDAPTCSSGTTRSMRASASSRRAPAGRAAHAAAGVALARLAAARGSGLPRGETMRPRAASPERWPPIPATARRFAITDGRCGRQSDWAGVRRVWSGLRDGLSTSWPSRTDFSLVSNCSAERPPRRSRRPGSRCALDPGDTKTPNVLLTRAYLADGRVPDREGVGPDAGSGDEPRRSGRANRLRRDPVEKPRLRGRPAHSGARFSTWDRRAARDALLAAVDVRETGGLRRGDRRRARRLVAAGRATEPSCGSSRKTPRCEGRRVHGALVIGSSSTALPAARRRLLGHPRWKPTKR